MGFGSTLLPDIPPPEVRLNGFVFVSLSTCFFFGFRAENGFVWFFLSGGSAQHPHLGFPEGMSSTTKASWRGVGTVGGGGDDTYGDFSRSRLVDNTDRVRRSGTRLLAANIVDQDRFTSEWPTTRPLLFGRKLNSAPNANLGK